MISFNKPFLTGNETKYIRQAVESGHISGNGKFTKKCQTYFEKMYGFKKALLTTSCTDALEMCALLLDIKPEDEVIMPSYTFVSTALAFVRQGAKIIFVDSRPDHPGIDENKIEELITPRTKAIVPVHYGGVSCNMDKIMEIANRYGLYVVEDAAQAIDSYYNSSGDLGKKSSTVTHPLGSIGHLGAFSFHETKNINAGEGGLLAINDERFIKRAEIIWEKGTNRAEFFRGEVNKYGWVDTGSSFLPSELTAAYLWAQLENIDKIQVKRKKIWDRYYDGLKYLDKNTGIELPVIPSFAMQNGHLFYLVCKNLNQRTSLIKYLKSMGIEAVFHYLSLHKSEFYKNKHDKRELKNCDRYADCLVRLPFYYEMNDNDLNKIITTIHKFTINN
jgi:dTDP-4-amino-4,6-dideoxygalactose transaminase